LVFSVFASTLPLGEIAVSAGTAKEYDVFELSGLME
jgi:hypothetical protein